MIFNSIKWEGNVEIVLKKKWIIIRKKGSHVIVGKNGERQTIPMHDELKKGLEKYLLKRLNEGK